MKPVMTSDDRNNPSDQSAEHPKNDGAVGTDDGEDGEDVEGDDGSAKKFPASVAVS